MKTLLLAIVLMSLPTLALAQWSDNFDSYNPGPLVPQSTWEYWDPNNPTTDGNVVNTVPLSPPNSLESIPTTDVVQQFSETSGQWEISGWSYVPTSAIGEQFFILCNTFPASASSNWSCQVRLNSNTNLVEDFNSSATLPLQRATWTQIRVEIDLDLDLQTVYYNNQLLFTDSWTGHVASGGALRLAVLDVFSNGGTSIYWDDMVLQRQGATAVEPSSWGQIKSTFR